MKAIKVATMKVGKFVPSNEIKYTLKSGRVVAIRLLTESSTNNAKSWQYRIDDNAKHVAIENNNILLAWDNMVKQLVKLR